MFGLNKISDGSVLIKRLKLWRSFDLPKKKKTRFYWKYLFQKEITVFEDFVPDKFDFYLIGFFQ